MRVVDPPAPHQCDVTDLGGGARHRGETLAAEVVAGDPPGRSAHNGTRSTRVGRGSRERKPHVTCTKNTITVWNARIEGAAVFSAFSGASGYLTGDFRLGAPRARRFLKQNTRRPKQRYRIRSKTAVVRELLHRRQVALCVRSKWLERSRVRSRAGPSRRPSCRRVRLGRSPPGGRPRARRRGWRRRPISRTG